MFVIFRWRLLLRGWWGSRVVVGGWIKLSGMVKRIGIEKVGNGLFDFDVFFYWFYVFCEW